MVASFFVGLAILLTLGAIGQPACDGDHVRLGHRPSRQRAAVDALRRTNQAQARTYSEQRRYAPLEEMPESGAIPVGFVPRLTFDRWGCTIVLKEMSDSCAFSLFSGDRGVVYEAFPVSTPLGDDEVSSGVIAQRNVSSVVSTD